MMRHPLIKTVWVLFIALFLSAQGLSKAHAIEHGGTDHSHEGVACDVAVAAPQHIVISPAPDVPLPVIRTLRENGLTALPRPVPHCFDGRAPPPRAPPL